MIPHNNIYDYLVLEFTITKDHYITLTRPLSQIFFLQTKHLCPPDKNHKILIYKMLYAKVKKVEKT